MRVFVLGLERVFFFVVVGRRWLDFEVIKVSFWYLFVSGVGADVYCFELEFI